MLFLLSEVSAGLVFDSEQRGLGRAESGAATVCCLAARQRNVSREVPSACFNAMDWPGFMTRRLSALNSR